jgi:hypothetical protein
VDAEVVGDDVDVQEPEDEQRESDRADECEHDQDQARESVGREVSRATWPPPALCGLRGRFGGHAIRMLRRELGRERCDAPPCECAWRRGSELRDRHTAQGAERTSPRTEGRHVGVARTMGLWDKLRQASNYLRKLQLSLGPDSYFQYKREREYERKQEDHAREDAKDSDERKRAEAERDATREREYEERYTRERERDIARERTEQEEELESDR